MGVDYSAEVGYGFAGEGEPPTIIAGIVEMNGGDIEGVDDWLSSCGWGELTYRVGGDQWSGPERWSVLSRSSLAYVDRYESVRVFHMDEMPDEAARQLREVRDVAGLKAYPIGWKLFWNVS